MIITVTLNPALDKTVELDFLRMGELNRVTSVVCDAGGKGINVSKTLKNLEKESIATGFLGGNTGRVIKAALDEAGIQNDFVWVEGETRTNTKIINVNGIVTEINEPGPEITMEKIHELFEKLDDYAAPENLFVLAGSVPGNVDKGIYSSIIERVKAKGAKVLLDTAGDAFRLAMDGNKKPDVIKPNHHELADFVGKKGLKSSEIAGIAFNILQNGVETMAVSMGANGALLFKDDTCVGSDALKVEAHSTVGAGDAFVAGLAIAEEEKLSARETMILCMAVSAGAVTTIGTKPPSKELVENLKKEVYLK